MCLVVRNMYNHHVRLLAHVSLLHCSILPVLCIHYRTQMENTDRSLNGIFMGLPIGLQNSPSIVLHDFKDSDGSESSSSSSSSSEESDEDESRNKWRDSSDEDNSNDQQVYNNRNDLDSSSEQDSRNNDSLERNRSNDDRDDGNEGNVKDEVSNIDTSDIDSKENDERKKQQIFNNKNELSSTERGKEENTDNPLDKQNAEKEISLTKTTDGDDINVGTSRPRSSEEEDSNESRPRGEDDGRPRGENTSGGKKKWPKLVPNMFKDLVPEAKKNKTKHGSTAESKKNNTKGQETVSKTNHGWPYFVPEVFKSLIPDTERNGTQAEDNSDTYKQNNNLSYTDTYVMDQYMENLPYAKSMLSFGTAGEHQVEHTDASGGEKIQSADFNIPPDEIQMQNGGGGYSSANESSGVGNNAKSPVKVNYSGMSDSTSGSHGVEDKNKSPGKAKPPGKEGGKAVGDSHQQKPDDKPGKGGGKVDKKNKATGSQSSGGGNVPEGQGSPKGDQYNRPPGNVPVPNKR